MQKISNQIKICILGLCAGLVSGMFSSGGGLILVPIFVYILKLDERKSRATSLFCVLPMVAITGIIYGKNDYLNWNIGLKCAIGGILGGIIGGRLLNKIPINFLKISFILFLFYAGISIILS